MSKHPGIGGKKIGVFGIDPGMTTGIAYGIVTLRGGTKEVFTRNPLVVEEVDCYGKDGVLPQLAEVRGTEELFGKVVDWDLKCDRARVHPSRRFVIIEDFVLRETGIGSTNREGLSPVRITSGLLNRLDMEYAGYDEYFQFIYQQASLAKTSMPNDRLRSLGLWTRGLEHGRDATRHVATWVKQQL